MLEFFGCTIPISLLDFILSFIISMYLDSKIFKGTVVFGKIIKLLKGKTDIFFGKSDYFHICILYSNKKNIPKIFILIFSI